MAQKKCEMKCCNNDSKEPNNEELTEGALYACLIPCNFLPTPNKLQNMGCPANCDNKAEKEKCKADDKKSSQQQFSSDAKEVELRASILYSGCDCEKRNGLQDECPRTGCHGSPECLTRPPTCGPCKYANAKHLVQKMKFKSRKANEGDSSVPEYSNGDDAHGKKKMEATLCEAKCKNTCSSDTTNNKTCGKCSKDGSIKERKAKDRAEVFIGPVTVNMPGASISYCPERS